MTDLNTSRASSLDTAVTALLREYGFHVTSSRSGSRLPDLAVAVDTSDGPWHLEVEVKESAAAHGAGRPDAILAARYIGPRQAARLRDHHQFFIDSVGNAYVRLPGFRLDVRGRPAPEPLSAPGSLRSAFGVSGTRTVFVLLVSDEVLSGTVRDIAAAAGTSVGTVSATLTALREHDFLIAERRSRRLRRWPQLAQLWLAAYSTRLAPTLEGPALTGPDPRLWISELRPRVQLGGASALAAMGYPIKPATTVVYGDPPWTEARQAGRLSRDGEPNVHLRKRFWGQVHEADPTLVPPLLVYADAAASDDPRQADVAQEMWEHDDRLRRLRSP